MSSCLPRGLRKSINCIILGLQRRVFLLETVKWTQHTSIYKYLTQTYRPQGWTCMIVRRGWGMGQEFLEYGRQQTISHRSLTLEWKKEGPVLILDE